MATTSLAKVFLVCFSGADSGKCTPGCGAAWSSALRDAQCLTPAGGCGDSEKRCTTLESEFNARYPLGMSGTGVFEENEFLSLRQKCVIDSLCPASVCDLAVSGLPLLWPSPDTPGGGTCSLAADAAFGYRSYNFLTWSILERYQKEGRGGSGGLSISSDQEYTHWACIDAPSCGFPQATAWGDDMACFRYSKLRGEFIFWDWNSNLKVSVAAALQESLLRVVTEPHCCDVA